MVALLEAATADDDEAEEEESATAGSSRTRATAGSRNPRVLPLPVGATPITSDPEIIAGQHCRCDRREARGGAEYTKEGCERTG